MGANLKFEAATLTGRVKSMLRVDLRRMLISKLFYIMLACALLVPVVMTVMLSMMDGQESTNPQTGEVTIMEGPESAWEAIGSLPADSSDEGEQAMAGGMDVLAMCNINMAFMGVAVFVCLFISDDFRSGYARNLFTVRARKGDYVISKTAVGFICGALMLLLYFIGAMLAGAICSLSFELGGLTASNLLMCILSKVALMLVFVPIYVLISVAAKKTAWLCICGSLGAGMLLFMTVGMITPLNSTAVHLLLCLLGGALFSFGLGAVSNLVLKKTSLV